MICARASTYAVAVALHRRQPRDECVTAAGVPLAAEEGGAVHACKSNAIALVTSQASDSAEQL